MLTLQEKLFIIDNSSSLLELNKEVLPEVHKENYYFVSYSHKDYKKVMKDILLLEEQGINIWYDSDMHIGENWEELAEMYISKYQCKGIIFYLSENSILSKACNKEVEYVLENNKQFFSINIPLDLPDSDNNIDMSGLDMLLKLKELGKGVDDNLIGNFKKAFPSNYLYLSYNDSIERKKEQIEKLVGEELFDFEIVKKAIFQKEPSIKLSFCKDNSLIKLNLKSKYLFDEKLSKLEKIGECVFTNLIKLKEVVLPNTVNELENRVFSNCVKLEKINLDNKFDYIGDYAFSNCKSLKIDNINSETIGKYAFSKCESLNKLTINTYYIDDYAFSDCVNLTEVNINDESFTNVISTFDNFKIVKNENLFGISTFSNCSSLKKIIYKGEENDINASSYMYLQNSSFKNCSSLEKITLRGKLDISKGSMAFQNCTNLTEVNLFTVDKSIIPLKMFENCKSLNHINGIKDYERIDSHAFKGCISLHYVDLKNVKYIDMYAFYNTNIVWIDLPNIISIESYAFKNIKCLTTLSVGENIENISLYAFENCSNLIDIEILSKTLEFEPEAFEGVYPETLTVCSDRIFNVFRKNLKNLKCLYIDQLTDEFELIIKELNFKKANPDKYGFTKYISKLL